MYPHPGGGGGFSQVPNGGPGYPPTARYGDTSGLTPYPSLPQRGYNAQAGYPPAAPAPGVGGQPGYPIENISPYPPASNLPTTSAGPPFPHQHMGAGCPAAGQTGYPVAGGPPARQFDGYLNGLQVAQPGYGGPSVPGYPASVNTPMQPSVPYGLQPPTSFGAKYPSLAVGGSSALPTSVVRTSTTGEESNARIEIGVACKKLRDKDVMSKSDPVCVLFQNNGGRWDEVGRTEMIRNNNNPQWTRTFQMTYLPTERQLLRFDIYDIDSTSQKLKHHDYLARHECALGQLMNSPNGQLVVNIQHGPSKGGQMVIGADRLSEQDETVEFQLAGRKLTNKDMFSKSDPFFVISKKAPSGAMIRIKTSEVVQNNLSPAWASVKLKVNQLCNGDYNRPVQVDVYDHDAGGNHDLIGSFSTNLNELRSQQDFYLVDPKKLNERKYNNSGQVAVKFCKIFK